jgi:hypothetical protein
LWDLEECVVLSGGGGWCFEEMKQLLLEDLKRLMLLDE